MNQREIKFRAWDKEKKKMRYPEVLVWGTDGLKVWRFFDEMIKLPELPPKQDIILMQFTGLKDKDGKEIWEGDILGKGTAERYEVDFQDGAFVIHTRFYGVKCLNEFAYLEVIGNIYENPELLK